jgi:serine protease Do
MRLFRAACVVGLAAPWLAAQTPDVLRQLSASLEALTRRVSPAVVQVFVTGYGAADGDVAVAMRESAGSGAVIDAAGYIVTNAHVVAGARRIRVLLPQAHAPARTPPGRSILKPAGTPVDASLAGVDRETDLALLKIDATGLPALTLGDSDTLTKGQIVLAFGSPLGLEDSVTLGVVSSVARQIKPDDPVIYIQTDAPINPGNSGGPLVDVAGRLVGVNTFILTQSGGSEGLGFAVPSNIVKNVVRQLREHGHVHRGEIGVRAQTITPLLAAGLGLPLSSGVVVADVAPGSTASRAGVEIQDIILTLNGKPMENARQFDVNLYRAAEGDFVKLELLRGEKKVTTEARVVARPDHADRLAGRVTMEQNLVRELGFLGLDLDAEAVAVVGPVRISIGVVVAARAPGAAPVSSLQPGDVIHALNRETITSVANLRAAIARLKTGDAMVLQVERSGRLLFVTFEKE